MVWNQPGNNGNKRDPLGFGGNTQGPNNGNSNDPNRPNDPSNDQNNDHWGDQQNNNRQNQKSIIDELLAKLKNSGNRNGSGNNGGDNSSSSGFPTKIVPLIGFVAVAVWFFSGFYTVREAEQAVVTRFGQFHAIKGAGLNWRPIFIDEYQKVDMNRLFDVNASGRMLTSDEKLVDIDSLNVKYRVIDARKYLFNVVDPNNSLSQATESALRGVIGRNELLSILSKGRDTVRIDTKKELENTISLYDMGIEIDNVSVQEVKPPREVQEAFDDAIAARENEQQLINEAREYRNRQLPLANGEAARITENAEAIRQNIILSAEGEVARFTKLLPEYRSNPEITKKRLYIETMERVLSNTRKIIMDSASNKLSVLPLDQLLKNETHQTGAIQRETSNVPEVNTQKAIPTVLPQTGNSSPAVNSPQRVSEPSVTQGRTNNANERLNAIRGGN